MEKDSLNKQELGMRLADLLVSAPGVWKELTTKQKELVKEAWRGPHWFNNELQIQELIEFFDNYSS